MYCMFYICKILWQLDMKKSSCLSLYTKWTCFILLPYFSITTRIYTVISWKIKKCQFFLSSQLSNFHPGRFWKTSTADFISGPNSSSYFFLPSGGLSSQNVIYNSITRWYAYDLRLNSHLLNCVKKLNLQQFAFLTRE